jgi:hypothetical protein
VKKTSYSAAAMTILGAGTALASGATSAPKTVYPKKIKYVFWRAGSLVQPYPVPSIAAGDSVSLSNVEATMIATSADVKTGYPKISPNHNNGAVYKSEGGVAGYEYTVWVIMEYENVQP